MEQSLSITVCKSPARQSSLISNFLELCVARHHRVVSSMGPVSLLAHLETKVMKVIKQIPQKYRRGIYFMVLQNVFTEFTDLLCSVSSIAVLLVRKGGKRAFNHACVLPKRTWRIEHIVLLELAHSDMCLGPTPSLRRDRLLVGPVGILVWVIDVNMNWKLVPASCCL